MDQEFNLQNFNTERLKSKETVSRGVSRTTHGHLDSLNKNLEQEGETCTLVTRKTNRCKGAGFAQAGRIFTTA